MKFLTVRKDGGRDSTVTGYWRIEVKWLFSIVLLRFDGPSRNAFHSHAFNCLSWLLAGQLVERFLGGGARRYLPSFIPFITRRTDFHKVDSVGTSWVLSIRGPWRQTWREFLPASSGFITLTHGRKVL